METEYRLVHRGAPWGTVVPPLPSTRLQTWCIEPVEASHPGFLHQPSMEKKEHWWCLAPGLVHQNTRQSASAAHQHHELVYEMVPHEAVHHEAVHHAPSSTS